MAASTLTNINFQSSVYGAVLDGVFTQRLGVLNSSMVEIPDSLVSPDITGQFINVPQFKALSGEPDDISSALTTTVNAAETFNNTGAWLEKEKAWGSDDLTRIVAGYRGTSDINIAIAQMLGEYWAGQLQSYTVNCLTGIMATALASTHILDDSSATITVPKVLQAKAKIGDNGTMLASMIANSKVFNDALASKIASYDTGGADSVVTGEFARLLGMNFLADDSLAAVSSVFTSYLLGYGSIGYKFRNRSLSSLSNATVFNVAAPLSGFRVQVEIDRNSQLGGGQDVLISRVSMLTHPFGMAFSTSLANPTKAQLATGSSWTKTANDDKLIKIVAYKSL